jgi:predicted RNA binding protein YcfA (HicA-like mRNA interferase family)
MASEERFSEVRRLLESHGWLLVRISGSHHIFTKPGRTPISIPVHKNKVKPVYVAKVRKVIENDPPQRPGA